MSNIFSPIDGHFCCSTTEPLLLPKEATQSQVELIDEVTAKMLRKLAHGSLGDRLCGVFGPSDCSRLFSKRSNLEAGDPAHSADLLPQVNDDTCTLGLRKFVRHKYEEVQHDLAMGQAKNKFLNEVHCRSTSILSPQNKLDELECALREELKQAIDWESNLMGEIAHLLNSTDSTDTGCLHRLRCVGKTSASLNVDDAIRLFVKHSFQEYRGATHGRLSQSSALHLFSTTCQFLMVATQRQHIERVCDRISCLSTVNGEERQRQLIELRNELVMRREYCVVEHRQLLVYEYYAEIKLREKQTKILLKLLEKDDSSNFQCLVQQLIMGGGKTKVLLPLLAKCKAEGNNLVLLLVPRALKNTTLADLQISSYSAFNQTAHLLEFNRADHVSGSSLEQMYENLWSWIVECDYVVTTEEAVQSLELSLIESLQEVAALTPEETEDSEGSDDGLYSPASPQPQASMSPQLQEEWKRVKALSKILHLLRVAGDALIDEVDSILDCRHELNFTVGEPHKVDMNFLRLLNAIYKMLDAIEIPSSNQSDTSTVGDLLRHDMQASISEQQYASHILPELAKLVAGATFMIHFSSTGDEQVIDCCACSSVWQIHVLPLLVVVTLHNADTCVLV